MDMNLRVIKNENGKEIMGFGQFLKAQKDGALMGRLPSIKLLTTYSPQLEKLVKRDDTVIRDSDPVISNLFGLFAPDGASFRTANPNEEGRFHLSHCIFKIDGKSIGAIRTHLPKTVVNLKGEELKVKDLTQPIVLDMSIAYLDFNYSPLSHELEIKASDDNAFSLMYFPTEGQNSIVNGNLNTLGIGYKYTTLARNSASWNGQILVDPPRSNQNTLKTGLWGGRIDMSWCDLREAKLIVVENGNGPGIDERANMLKQIQNVLTEVEASVKGAGEQLAILLG